MGKYLVTGGCGFIGSHLVKSLVLQGHQVKVIDDLSTGKKENLPVSGVEFIHASVLNRQILFHALQDVQGCFHLAAVASVEKSTKEWAKTHEINQTAIILLFEEISRLQEPIFVVYASSASVYGNSQQFPLKEIDPVFPISPYGVDKFACEKQAFVAWHLFKIPSIGLRFFNVYGQNQDPASPYSGVITKFLNKLEKNEPLEIFGDGHQKRDFVHVSDVIHYLIQAKTHCRQAEVYNVCSGKGYSIHQLIEIIQEIINKKLEIRYLPKRRGDPMLSLGDPNKLIGAFQYKPKISLKEGLNDLIEKSLIPKSPEGLNLV